MQKPVLYFQFVRQNVGGSAGEDRKRNPRMHHAVQKLVDRAIAAGGDDQVRSIVDLALRQRPGSARASRGNQRRLRPLLTQEFNATLEQVRSPSQTARTRVVNDGSLPVGGVSVIQTHHYSFRH